MKNFLIISVLISKIAFAEENVISRSEYINSWKLVAIEQMK
jgi:hypothetical protein